MLAKRRRPPIGKTASCSRQSPHYRAHSCHEQEHSTGRGSVHKEAKEFASCNFEDDYCDRYDDEWDYSRHWFCDLPNYFLSRPREVPALAVFVDTPDNRQLPDPLSARMLTRRALGNSGNQMLRTTVS